MTCYKRAKFHRKSFSRSIGGALCALPPRQAQKLKKSPGRIGLTIDRILYEVKKLSRISWYYSQWQDGYEALKTKLEKEIQFFRGLPKFHDDLREIDPKYRHTLALKHVPQGKI